MGSGQHRTSRGRVWRDRLARHCVHGGGLLIIACILGIFWFLVVEVAPLFGSGEFRAAPPTRVPEAPLALQTDPYRTHAAMLLGDGVLHVQRLADGADVASQRLLPAVTQCASALATPDGLWIAAADTAGRVHSAQIDWGLGFDGSTRTLTPRFVVAEPVQVDAAQRPLRVFTLRADDSGTKIAAQLADGTVAVVLTSTHKNEFSGEIEQGRAERVLPANSPFTALAIDASGQNLYAGTADGNLHWWPKLAAGTASPQVIPTGAAAITRLGLLLGDRTLVLGRADGSLSAWFAVRQGDQDLFHLQRIHEFPPLQGAITGLAASQRHKGFVAATARGELGVYYATTGEIRHRAHLLAGGCTALAYGPKADGALVAGPAGLTGLSIDDPHPEATFRGLFRPIWYEDAQGPELTWQSTGGTDDFEPKYGMWPLVFGTLKATLYCLLLGVPLALLAAIYTSEFLRPRLRAKVKPLLETMASLPSVVLGFLAALVFAPWIEASLLPVLSLAIGVPLVWLLGAQLFFALPPRWVAFADRWRLAGIAILLPLGVHVSLCWLGPWLEHILFDGDLKQWLAAEQYGAGDARRGTPFGGWFLLLLPLTATLSVLGLGSWRGLRRGPWSGCLRLGTGLAASVGLGLGVALLLSWSGFDLRGTAGQPGLVGTYVQRNALIVGLAMGFAVIPIIYTIAEDALTAVPEHLRAASLGAGATPWQTAVRIILPTAMSGIFSAVMVGLGRAIGETMIVLMAAGNTPVLDLNPFNGFRTLSANIAVELPEAVRDSTHYRMLYLAAFVLFLLTFLLNTVAELVRQRFRKRAYQL